MQELHGEGLMSGNHYWPKSLLFYVLFRLIGPLKSYSLVEVGYSENAFEDRRMLQWLLSKLKPVLVSLKIQDFYHYCVPLASSKTKKLYTITKLEYMNIFNCPGKKNMVGNSVKFSPMHQSVGHL